MDKTPFRDLATGLDRLHPRDGLVPHTFQGGSDGVNKSSDVDNDVDVLHLGARVEEVWRLFPAFFLVILFSLV